MTSKIGLGKVLGTMLCKVSKIQVRPLDSKVNEARIAANPLNQLLVIFKPVNRLAESVPSARRPKGLGSLRRRGSHRSRSGKLKCLNKESAVRPLQVANELSNRGRHNTVRRRPDPMLLKAHATPALPRCPASEVPLASNARPTPEI